MRSNREQTKNPVDELFEKIVMPLLSNPQYKEMSENGEFSAIFSLFFKELAELVNLHTLFIHNYVPTAINVAKKTQQQISTSKYSRFYRNPASFDGVIDEIVRVGYVKLFHRWEHFQAELIAELSNRFNFLLEFEKVSFEQFILKYFELEISNPYSYSLLRKINWIANCEKHYNGYPRKKNPPEIFKNANKDEKLKIPYAALNEDILSMIRFNCNLVLALTFAGQSRYLYTLGAFGEELIIEQRKAMLASVSTVAGIALNVVKELKSD